MAVSTSDLQELVGKAVTLVVANDEGGADEIEGKIEQASEVGIAFKEKGRREVSLYLPEQIEDVEASPEKPKKVSQRKLKPISENNMRQHLADRHGMPRSEANSLTDEEAVDLHDELDHSDLGHRHESPDVEDEDEDGDDED